MIEKAWAVAFAQKWIEAFNSHDLEQVFELYEDDFEMTSPYIVERMGEESGVLKGKTAVQPYWEKSLHPDSTLKFELLDVFVGVNTVIVRYNSIGRKEVCETFTFSPSGKVQSGCSQHGRELK